MKKCKLIVALSLVALSTALSGCVPHINSYYLPESLEGHRDSHSTLTSGAPVWILQKGGATFNFRASKMKGGGMWLSLNVQPLHSDAETSLSAKVREEARKAVKPITIGLASFKNGVNIRVGDIKNRTKSVRVVKGTYGTNYSHNVESINNDIHVVVYQYLHITAIYKGAEADVYVVQWPPIEIDHQQVMLPAIEFTWKSGVQVQFING